MESSDFTYHEDFCTLKGIIESLGCSEQFIREIQKSGLMLPEVVKFGSVEIEIYSNLDQNIGRGIKESLKTYRGFSEAIISAQAHIDEVYRVALGRPPTDKQDSPEPGQLSSEPRVKKLLLLSELLKALDISEEFFQTMRQHIQIEPMRLLIPGSAIEYYFEDDYLRLRYVLTLIGQDCSLEEAARVAYDWGMYQLW
jgi:hypothetical protein